MTAEMRVLTVRQPWAWAIVHGGKDVENRSRNIAGDYRGLVAIHTAIADAENAPEYLWREHAAHYRARNANPHAIASTRGAIVGVVDLVDVHRSIDYDCRRFEMQVVSQTNMYAHFTPLCSDWSEWDRTHLVLKNARPLRTPIAFTGGQGLRRLDPTITRQVLEQLVHTCPECLTGKHRNCNGTTWSNELDHLVPCDCTLTDNHPQAQENPR